MKKRYFGLGCSSVGKLERVKWIVEQFLTTDLEELPYLQRQAFIEDFFRYLCGYELEELTNEEANQYEKWKAKGGEK